MARIRKWQETLVVAWVAVFSFALAWPRRTHKASSYSAATYSRLVASPNGRTALGLELMAKWPYGRLFRASLVPVSLPLAAGAFITMAGSPVPAAAEAAVLAASSCPVCNTHDAPCCSVNTNDGCCNNDCDRCHDIQCTSFFSGGPGGYTCWTCGDGTCGACGD